MWEKLNKKSWACLEDKSCDQQSKNFPEKLFPGKQKMIFVGLFDIFWSGGL